MELELYEINDWIPQERNYENFYFAISYNTHPVAANILYANINSLTEDFHKYFYLKHDTVYLYEKLQERTPFYNHLSKLAYYRFTKMHEDLKIWKTIPIDNHQLISHICQHFPLSEVRHIPYEKLNWFWLSLNTNECVVRFLIQNRPKIIWGMFAENSSDAAVNYLLEEERKGWSIDWFRASKNTNEKMISQFYKNKDSLSVFSLSLHSSDSVILLLLDKLYNKIHWENFCSNPNEYAVDHIINISNKNTNDRRLYWNRICENPNKRLFSILRENKTKIVWENFFKNPICFQYDYAKIKQRFSSIKKELEEIFMHPDNIMAMIECEKMDNETDFDVISRLNI
jgi:hypothetical protein